MKVHVKRIDKELPLPEYHTPGAVGFDLVMRTDAVIAPREAKVLPTNIIVEIPEGYMLAVLPRSSLFKKKGLIQPNSMGVIDQDYHGPDDEVGLYVYNMTDKPVEIKRGERLGQAVFIKVEKAQWEEVEDDMRAGSRGGFGSSG